ncbi:MAG TPA: arsenic resistance N-acetyltransferase ArsN2 [bacterium]
MEASVVARSLELFESQFRCAESVLIAVTESRGVKDACIPRIATGFCSGLARTGGLCGAVAGSILAMNWFTGRSRGGESTDLNYDLVQHAIRNFMDKFGSVDCRTLIGCDLATEEGRMVFKANALIEKCREYVAEAARSTDFLLAKAMKDNSPVCRTSNSLPIRKAEQRDMEGILDLLRHLHLPVEGVSEHLQNFLVITDGPGISGVVGLEIYGRQALIRSLAVAPVHQGKGLGSRLFDSALAEARDRGVEELVLLTQTAEPFFAKRGFKRVSSGEVKGPVLSSVEFRSACPASAVVMRSRLE